MGNRSIASADRSWLGTNPMWVGVARRGEGWTRCPWCSWEPVSTVNLAFVSRPAGGGRWYAGRRKYMRTPLDHVHSDTVALLEIIEPQMSSMLLAQDVVLTLWFQLGFAWRHCTPYMLGTFVKVVFICPHVSTWFWSQNVSFGIRFIDLVSGIFSLPRQVSQFKTQHESEKNGSEKGTHQGWIRNPFECHLDRKGHQHLDGRRQWIWPRR